MAEVEWDNIDHEVACPRCDYNLRGLAEPRCPECGHQFKWSDVLRLKRFPRVFLYEYAAPSDVLRLLQTFLLSLLPRQFWQRVTPLMPVVARRLVLFWWMGTVLFGLTVLAAAWVQTYRDPPPPAFVFFRTLDNPLYNLSLGNAWGGRGLQVLVLLSLLVVWPWFTTACFWLFRVSLRRADIRLAHWFRCVVYSGDIIWIVGAVVLVLTFIEIDQPMPGVLKWISKRTLLEGDGLTVVAGLLCLEVILTYRLVIAARMYLAIQHASLLAIASQVIFTLFMLIIAVSLR